MNTPNDGGPAFPIVATTGDPRDGVYCANGLSIRDWFAGMALQGLIRHPDAVGEAEDTIAAWAYAAADSMIQQREKGGV
jgi:hypothetical protein